MKIYEALLVASDVIHLNSTRFNHAPSTHHQVSVYALFDCLQPVDGASNDKSSLSLDHDVSRPISFSLVWWAHIYGNVFSAVARYR